MRLLEKNSSWSPSIPSSGPFFWQYRLYDESGELKPQLTNVERLFSNPKHTIIMATQQRSTFFEVLEDSRVNCLSVMTSMLVRDYIEMARVAYESRGGISGQREKLQTTSAIRIRKRMVDDVQQGAVLPPIVVGVVLEKRNFKKFRNTTTRIRREMLFSVEPDRLSIIDGMQRTTALLEAYEGKNPPPDRKVRVEFWVSERTGSLIYRMLVLNTGQVPWNLRRQIEVVFRSLVLELKSAVFKLDVLETNQPRRRTRGGQFQADDLVELFLVFGGRKEKINIRERLADEFTRLDFMEAAAKDNFTEYFCKVLEELVLLDIAFDQYHVQKQDGRFVSGKDLFASQPACVGFITALAIEIFGRPGVDRGVSDQEKRLKDAVQKLTSIRKKLDALDEDALGQFLCLQTLSETLSRIKTSQSVGDAEREYFLKAFQVMLEEGSNLEKLDPCWRAY